MSDQADRALLRRAARSVALHTAAAVAVVVVVVGAAVLLAAERQQSRDASHELHRPLTVLTRTQLLRRHLAGGVPADRRVTTTALPCAHRPTTVGGPAGWV